MAKKILAFSIIILLLLIMGGGTWAFFSDTESSAGNLLSAGTLDLTADIPAWQTAVVQLEDMYPGQRDDSSYATLENVGSLTGDLNIGFSAVQNIGGNGGSEFEDGIGDLGGVAEIAVFLDIDQNENWNAGDIGLNPDGSTYSFGDNATLQYAIIDSFSNMAWYQLKEMASGVSLDFRVYAHLPESASNEIQGDAVTFDIDFYLVQAGMGVDKTPLTAIGPIDGTPGVASLLTAGALTPGEATATYQWVRCSTPSAAGENITGATSNTYTLTAGDYGYYIKVAATGIGSYNGTVTSSATSQVTEGILTGISDIIGTTQSGETLTAGEVTPSGATVTWQWQRVTEGGESTDISGATSNTYTITGADNNCYLRVVVTGTGVYTGTVSSALTDSRVTDTITPITAIDATSGTAMVGQIVTAGSLTPSSATATWQWQRCSTSGGTYENIAGAVSNTYTLTAGDYGYYVKVAATGSGAYSGTVTSSPKGPVAAATITAISNITGTTTVGETLTAGSLTPPGATATWQWQRSTVIGGTYEAIAGATSNTYVLASGDSGYYIKVTATGSGVYSGTVTSAASGPVVVSSTPVTAIGEITGTVAVGQVLTAGALTPSNATVTWQWQRCSTVAGTYVNVSGATSNTYTVTSADYGYYFKVVAAGSGAYSGTVTSTATGQTAAGTVTGIYNIIGTTAQGETVTAGAVTPAGATVTYQWQYSEVGGSTTFTNISGATQNTYHFLWGTYDGRYVRVVVTGYGSYTGTVYSNPAGPVTSSTTPITDIGAISGTMQVGQTISAGTLTPSGASATWQWKRSATVDGTYENISGATAGTYTLTAGDNGYYLKVTAIGSGAYSGTVTSSAAGPVSSGVITGIGAISGTTTTGETLTAGTVSPAAATVTWQWQRCATSGGTYENIAGETANTYLVRETDAGYYIKVVVTGSGAYTGSATSVYSGPVTGTSTPLTGIGAITGTAQVGETLTAGTLTPSGATATYQWQRCATAGGTYANISGATSDTYALTASDYGYYIKVVATGSGSYSGTVTSTATAQVAAGLITGVADVVGDPQVGETVAAGDVTPEGATYTIQWQYSDWNGTVWNDIPGATGDTYYLQWATYQGSYLRVKVTGTGAYSGTAYSDPTPVRVHS